MRGIILAGGSGTRLHPMTLVTSKQLLPVYDKPMIYYPLSTLMLAGVREIFIITTPEDLLSFKRLLGGGEQWGLSLSYAVQPKPEGLAQAYLIGAEFVDGSPSVLILGDNIFYGHGLPEALRRIRREARRRYSPIMCAIRSVTASSNSIAPDAPSRLKKSRARPRSNWAVTGLYFYDQRAPQFAAQLKPSARGELEITDLNRIYMEIGELQVARLGPRLRLARHRHARIADRGERICARHRTAAGSARRLSRGDRLSRRMDRRGAGATGLRQSSPKAATANIFRKSSPRRIERIRDAALRAALSRKF